MTPERWSQISAVFDAVLAREPRSREAFLADACAGDDALRLEVERLLAEDEQTAGMLDHPLIGSQAPTGEPGGSDLQATETALTGKLIQGRFAIRARLGAGGMGEVYRAENTKLRRVVALKRLAPKLRSDDRYRKRLLKEAQRASSLDNPHIARVYDVLEEDDDIFLVMEYIDGTVLRKRIGSPMPAGEFVEIAIQCAEALVAAHQAGIIHCDLKPENIMLTTAAGQVKVLDFGIAKRLRSGDQGATTQSIELQDLGTPAYMAPEVLEGNPPDAKSDIYSLGVTFHEVLTGRRPPLMNFPAANASTPEGDGVPPRIETILEKMLQRDPTQRYSDARDLLQDLRSLRESRSWESKPEPACAGLVSRRRGLAIGAVLLLAVLASLAVAQLRPWVYGALHPVPQQKQVAVLPFSVAGANAETTAFANGLSEVLSAKLTQLTQRPQFQLVPVSEVRARHVATAADARKEFGVNLVIEGTWQQAGGTVHVVPVLIDAANNRQLRADEFVAASSDPIGLEAQVASGVLQMLEIELQPGEQQSFANQGTTAPDAYAYYLRGRGYLGEFQKPENVENAISVFGRALTEDPRYGLAYAGLGEAYWREYEHTQDAHWVDKARQACAKATELGNAGAAGNNCLGLIDDGTGKYREASEQFQKALALEPTSDASYVGLGEAYEGLGRMDDAERTYQQAIKLRSQDAACYNWLGMFYYRRARYSDAIRLFSQVVKISPDSYIGYSNLGGTYVDVADYLKAVPILGRSIAIRPTYLAYSNLGTAYFNQGRFSDAVDSYERALKLDDRHYDVWGNLGDAYYWTQGRRDDSTKAYRRAITLATKQYEVNPNDAGVLSYIAQYHAMLGETELALDCIGRALRLDPKDPEVAFTAAIVYDQIGDIGSTLTMLEKSIKGGISLATVRATPTFSNMDSDPRFRSLLKIP